jgi:phage gp29-like protein
LSDEVEELKAQIRDLREELRRTKRELDDDIYYYTNITPHIEPLIKPLSPEELELAQHPLQLIKKEMEEDKKGFYIGLAMFLSLLYLLIAFSVNYFAHYPLP